MRSADGVGSQPVLPVPTTLLLKTQKERDDDDDGVVHHRHSRDCRSDQQHLPSTSGRR